MRIRLRRYKETLFYCGIFGMLFLAPVVLSYIRSASEHDFTFRWMEIWLSWKILAMYLVAFVIHNSLIAPIFIYKNKKKTYFLAAFLLLLLFGFAQYATRPRLEPRHPPRHVEMEQRHGDMAQEKHSAAQVKDGMTSERQHPGDAAHRYRRPHPPLVFGQAEFVGGIILFFMFGLNLAVKLYFKNEKYMRQMTLMEKENLEHQLAYLKYQINPHFFMNTLNNIHALVDIDPEKAKRSIVVLSKMMRYILYEGDSQTIPLGHEVAFIGHYVQLMRMRYTDRVSIHLDLPEPEAANNQGYVPPLLFITFVENAFKHGISYQKKSYIDVRIASNDGAICFSCRNSIAQQQVGEKGGIGLTNVRKRLDLIYHDTFQLDIHDDGANYEVTLTLPANPPAAV